MVDVLYWIWLSLACGSGSNLGDILFTQFDNPLEIYKATEANLKSVERIEKNAIEILSNKNLDEAKAIKDYCLQNNIGILTLDDDYYPKRLKLIRKKPLLLYYKGQLIDIDDNVCIAMVGTRRMTEYGKRSAYTMSYDLTRGGAIIVSGMALGIDGMCHRGCLDVGGHTIAVLGCGIDRVYPNEHKELMDEIILHGAIITEFKPFTPPSGFNFPIRNRIISGLCQGTMVVEADLRSGALITARTALYQGRDIYALPGKVGEFTSSGTNKLIKDGAKMVTSASDILEEYEFIYPHRINIGNLYSHSYISRKPITPKLKVAANLIQNENFYEENKNTNIVEFKDEAQISNKTEADLSELNEVDRNIYNTMSYECAMTSDEISRQGINISDVLTSLTMLEIHGFVQALPGGKFILVKM